MKNKNINKKVFPLVLLHIAMLCIIGVLVFMKFPCPFKSLFGIPCPACGTLHALEALLRFDFDDYIKFNYLAAPMVFAVWVGIHKSSLFKNSGIVDFLIYAVCVLTVIRYILIIA